MLGPGLNLMRIGLNGRDVEYMSGEDPYLTSELVGPMVRGIQSNRIIATMKHFANNERETHRNEQNSIIDQRT